MASEPIELPNDDESIDAVLLRIVDPEVRAYLIDLVHAIEASQGNMLSRREQVEKDQYF